MMSLRWVPRWSFVGVGAGAVFGWVTSAFLTSCSLDPQALGDVVFDVPLDEVWRDGAPKLPPPRPGEARLLVTNNLDDTVSVLSLERLLSGDTRAELARFSVGIVPLEREGPHHVAVDDTGRFAFVGISNYVPGGGSGPHGVHGNGRAEGHALRIDLRTQATTAATRVDRNPGDVRLTPDGRFLLLTHFDLVAVNEAANGGDVADSRLAVLEPETLARRAMVPLCPAAHGMGLSRTNTRPTRTTVVASCLSDEVAVVDLDAVVAGTHEGADVAGNDAVTRVPLLDEPQSASSPLCGPYAVTMSPDDQTAWVSCYRSGELLAVDLATRTRIGPALVLPGLAVFGDFASGPVPRVPAEGAEDDVGAPVGAVLALAVQEPDGIAWIVEQRGGQARIERFWALSPETCLLPHTTLFVDEDRALVVVCEGDKRQPGQVVALDVASGAVLGRVGVGVFPDDVALALAPETP
jgi:hypothetical protein